MAKQEKEKTLKLKKGRYPVVNSEIAFEWSGAFGGFFWGIPGYGTADGFLVTNSDNARKLAKMLNTYADAVDKLHDIAAGKVPPAEMQKLVDDINQLRKQEGAPNA